jgi:hypothetical protein
MSENAGERGVFLDEVWLTPLQIARRFGYGTDKPIRKAIMRGELKATRAPCRRKLLVAESELLRWIDGTLAFQPETATSERSMSPTGVSVRQKSRRSGMPRLSYDTAQRPSA